MKLIAYTVNGPHLAWSEVDGWSVSGAILTIWRRGQSEESIALPRKVIGLHDDGPHLRPAPTKYELKSKPKEQEIDDVIDQVERDAPQRRHRKQRA